MVKVILAVVFGVASRRQKQQAWEASFLGLVILANLGGRLGLALAAVEFVDGWLDLLLKASWLILQGVHTVKEELSQGLPNLEALSYQILLAVELHIFLSGEVPTAIAAVPKGIIEVVAKQAHPIALSLIFLLGWAALLLPALLQRLEARAVPVH